MKTLMVMCTAALVMVTVDMCEVPPIEGQLSPLRWQFVTVTTDTFDGAAGVFTYTAACEALSPGMRWCTTREIVESANNGPISAEAWVRADGFVSAGASVLATFESVTGWNADGGNALNLTCRGWSSANGVYDGLAVGPGGSFNRVACNSARPVACCAER